MWPISIVPSFPAPNFEKLEAVLTALQGCASGFQVDVVDGKFATTVSWPGTEGGIPDLMKLQPWVKLYTIELDLMVIDPEAYFSSIAAMTIENIVVHYQANKDMRAIIKQAETYGLQVRLAFTNDISDDIIVPLVVDGVISAVQIMGIKTVGEQGQPFDKRTFDRVRQLRSRFPDLDIAVDGAVNETTIVQLYAAGANRFAPGSAIVRQANPCDAYKHLISLIG